MTLRHKTALITGSTSGIGYSIAESLAKEGCRLMLNGLGDAAQIEGIRAKLSETYGVEVAYSGANMAVASDIETLIHDTAQRFGSVDILVNNAGVQFTAPTDQFPDDKWDLILSTNLSSSFHTIKHTLPLMQAKGAGRIINIISAHGLVGSVQKSAYVSAKHGLAGLTKVVALENAQQGITCNGICPGWVLTPLVEKQIKDRMQAENKDEATVRADLLQKQPSRQFVDPADVGALVVFLCGDSAKSITGSLITIDGGWTAE